MIFEKKFSMDVIPRKTSLMPGEEFEASIIIKPEEKFKIIRLTGTLEGTQKLIWYSTHVHATKQGTITYRVRHIDKIRIFRERKIMVEDLEVNPFREYEYTFSVTLPENIPPSFTGDRVINVYQFTVKAEIKWALDKKITRVISVHQRPEETSLVNTTKSLDGMRVTIKMPSIARAGEELQGELIINVREEEYFDGVRIDLLRHEKVINRREESKRKIMKHRFKTVSYTHLTLPTTERV